MTDLEAARRRVRELYEKRDRGDVAERRFERRLAEETVALFRAAAREALETGDRVLVEHHVARGHLRLARSVLSEPQEEATSLFVAERALVRVRAVIDPAGPSARDPFSVAKVDSFPLTALRGLRRRSEFRWLEVAAGAAIVAFAFLFSPWLLVTGKLMIALGVAGILHALLLPTRWIEIEVEGERPEPPLEVHKVLRRSARETLAALREALRAPRGPVPPPRAAGPVREAPPEDAAEAGARAVVRSDGRRTRVLLVDDDETFRETLAKVLGRRGIDVTLAEDGEEGLTLARDREFDVVVLDLKMPGLDGLEVLDRLRVSRPKLPVLMLTGQGTAGAGLDALGLGAVDFLLKPVTPDRLALAIETTAGGAPKRMP